MASFRKEILGQIERIDAGRIFTFRDLSFDTEKTANVAVLLSEQSRKGWENCPSIRTNSSAI